MAVLLCIRKSSHAPFVTTAINEVQDLENVISIPLPLPVPPLITAIMIYRDYLNAHPDVDPIPEDDVEFFYSRQVSEPVAMAKVRNKKKKKK